MLDTQTTATTTTTTTTTMPADLELDMLGQQPLLLRIYTQICHCYPLPDTSPASQARIVATLTAGLERLADAFPWVAGEVVDDSGVFCIRPLDRAPKLVVKDQTNDDGLTWAALEAAGFPMHMLDEGDFAPVATYTMDSVSRVFAVQATFIPGGLILVFAGHHGALDMVGLGNVISWLSRACAGGTFAKEELEAANRSRHDTIPLLSEEEVAGLKPDILASQIMKKQDSQPAAEASQEQPPPPPTLTWATFTFTPSALSALKASATSTLPSGAAGSQGFITTDDALTALIWSATTRVRLPRLTSTTPPTTISSFARAVNIRPYFNIPHAYAGLFQNMTYHKVPIDTLASPSGLGAVAGNLRAALDPKTTDITLRTRALATFMKNTKDKTAVSFTADMNLSAGFMLSSWARVDSYELDFGLGLGKPASVRRPQFTPVESLGYLLPRAGNGDMSIAICLREEDMAALRKDEEWMKYASYVG
ncbi:putative trichothecene 3-O-acetyltransferase [Plectosphaerella cucumerina]|uniref:Trichothecene 3-O-acetyltransferase n=1 Tax=Plectosphaerella cucumerina TaxID=40658 RepID=A0A8K0TL92_9PEZI|nr:putative trichothecene 3-O-acetyltransferase [Plectosphaerella cucumerina]